jgi:hypothetical protein
VVFLDTAAVTGADADIEVVKAINKLTAAGANRLVRALRGSFLDLETRFKKVVLRKYPRRLLGACRCSTAVISPPTGMWSAAPGRH